MRIKLGDEISDLSLTFGEGTEDERYPVLPAYWKASAPRAPDGSLHLPAHREAIYGDGVTFEVGFFRVNENEEPIEESARLLEAYSQEDSSASFDVASLCRGADLYVAYAHLDRQAGDYGIVCLRRNYLDTGSPLQPDRVLVDVSGTFGSGDFFDTSLNVFDVQGRTLVAYSAVSFLYGDDGYMNGGGWVRIIAIEDGTITSDVEWSGMGDISHGLTSLLPVSGGYVLAGRWGGVLLNDDLVPQDWRSWGPKISDYHGTWDSPPENHDGAIASSFQGSLVTHDGEVVRQWPTSGGVIGDPTTLFPLEIAEFTGDNDLSRSAATFVNLNGVYVAIWVQLDPDGVWYFKARQIDMSNGQFVGNPLTLGQLTESTFS